MSSSSPASPTSPYSPSLPRVFNRLEAVMRHSRRYAFRGQSRLAKDAGISRSAVSRLLAGTRRPSFDLALTVVGLLEQDMGRALPLRELFSFDGTYPTPSLCQVVGCSGCLPEEVYAEDETILPEYRSLHAGEWPNGLTPSSSVRAENANPPFSPDDTS